MQPANNKKYLSIYLAATILFLGIISPIFIHDRLKLNNDNDMNTYNNDMKLQSLHDAWLKTDEAQQEFKILTSAIAG